MIGLLILEIILFVIGMYLLKKYDDKAGIKVNKNEYVIMGLIFAVTEIVLFSLYGYCGEFVYHCLMLYYLIFAAFIDYKTKRVYRIGSIGFILVAMLVFTFVKDMSSYDRLEKLLCVLIFSMFSVMQGTLGWMGWGDVLTYVGMFFYLSTWKYECMSLELFAVYMLLANCIFLILNMKKFNWKRRKLKEDAAFLPGMAGALVILELSRLLN